MKNLIEHIINEKTTCYFISPSFGDAASSTGEAMAYLSGKVEMHVINIFTSAGDGKITFSARQFLKHAESKNPQTLYALRKQEDANALSPIQATIHNLDAADALWRKKKETNGLNKLVSRYLPEVDRLYPTYQLHISAGKLVKEDQKTIQELREKLQEIVKEKKNFKVFCPISFQNHVDYLLVRDVCLDLFGEHCVFYSLPIEHLQDKAKNAFLKTHNYTPFKFSITSEVKNKVLKGYVSQETEFFGEGSLVFRPEIYYVSAKPKERHFDVRIYSGLTKELLSEWQHLWEISPFKRFFNTPLWFQAATKTFTYEKQAIIGCYEKGKLIGLLPLVLTEKYGVPTYSSPGNQYYDNSSLLLKENDIEIFKALLEKLSELGNFYLAEVEATMANMCGIQMPEVGIVKSSRCPYLILKPDPYRFLSKKNKRIIAKKFKDAEGNFSCKIYTENAQEQLKTLLNIDAESSKKADFKETFSDPLLEKLLENINELDNKVIVVALLFYKDEPICYNYGFIFDKTYIGSGTAYKESYRPFAPGRVLAYSLLPELVKMGLNILDFSRGYTRYKRDFAPYAYHQYTLFYAKNPVVMRRWKMLEFTKNFLEEHPALFEFVRKNKNRFLRK